MASTDTSSLKIPSKPKINSENTLLPLRRLLVSNDKGELIEKYRLMVGDELVYAKGLINFDWNMPKKLGDLNGPSDYSSGYTRDSEYNIYIGYDYEITYPSGQKKHYMVPPHTSYFVYAFFNDGFYYKPATNYQVHPPKVPRADLFYRYEKSNHTENPEKLSEIYHCNQEWGIFDGWWTEKDGGLPVDTIKQVKENTSLFDYKDENLLPEITLYAHWKPYIYKKITIHNTVFTSNKNRNLSAKVSFYYNNKKITNNKVIENITYGTNLSSYLRKVTKVEYKSWGKNAFNNSKLNKGPQRY